VSLSNWEAQVEKINRKNRLKGLYEKIGKLVTDKGYLKDKYPDDPELQSILKEIEKAQNK
jgi:hypothetical protein